METIKNLLHKDKDNKEEQTGATGKLTGEGTHFDSDKPQYGAVPGVGISSFTEGQTQSHTAGTGSTTAAYDAAGTTTTSTRAPQVQQPDLGERSINPTTTSITGAASGQGSTFTSKPTDDVASVGSIKSGVQGLGGSNTLTQDLSSNPVASSHSTATTATGLAGTSLADRSVPPGNSAVVAEPYTERAFPLGSNSSTATTTGNTTTTAVPSTTQNWPDGGATSSLDRGAISSTSGNHGPGHHPTFTGERLDTAHAGHLQGHSFREPGATLTSSSDPSSATQHHTGRDAALAGGAAGIAGAGLHEHDKHQHASQDAALAGGTSAPAGTGLHGHEKHHHTGQDAAAAGATAGAVGVGVHEHEKHQHAKHEGDEKTRKSSGGFLGLGKSKDKNDHPKEATHTSEHHKDSKLGMFGLLDRDPAHYQHDGDPQHTAKEKYFGGAAAAAHDPSASGVPEEKHHSGKGEAVGAGGAAVAGAAAYDEHEHGKHAHDKHKHDKHEHSKEERDAAAVVGGTAVAGTAAHEKHEHQKHEHKKEEEGTGEKKQGLLGKLFHRDNPNKLHKDPPEGQVAPAAHETFVRPTPQHEQHIGIDGPIGRVGEVSGAGGSDARHAVPASELPKDLEIQPGPVSQTLQDRADAAPQGVVIEPRTGLPMNVGKYGTGHGGTDGAEQIAGYDEKTNIERLHDRDELLKNNQEITWDKIASQRSGAPNDPISFASKINEENTVPTHKP